MNETLNAGRTLLAWAAGHRDVLIVVGLAVTVFLVLWTVRRAVKSGRPDTWLARLSFLVGFAWSGEAMWEVATQRLHLSYVFAGFAFFLFESQMATAMMRAERHQALHNHPGKHGRSVWLIAVVAGAIAGMAGDSPVETVLRLTVPLLVAHQWWAGLTGEGTDKPTDAISWTLTPRRILVRLGLAKPGEQDLQTVDRERHIRAIAVVSHRLHSTSSTWRRTWCHARLRRLAMHADDEMLDAARLRVERVWQAAERTRPVAAADRTLPASVRAEAEAVRAEAEAARTAEAEAVAWAEAASEHAEAEASRRTRLEAEAEALREQVEAEVTRRAKAEVEAEAARAEAHAAELRASRIQGKADAASVDWLRRLEAAETAVAQTAQALNDEQQRRHEAEATAAANDKALAREARRRQVAEAEARRKTEASAALDTELAALRERLAETEARTPRRTRRAAASTQEPLTFDGAPVPDVSGVGARTVLAVLRARQENPDETQKELAKRVRVTDRTVRAVLAARPERDFVNAAS